MSTLTKWIKFQISWLKEHLNLFLNDVISEFDFTIELTWNLYNLLLSSCTNNCTTPKISLFMIYRANKPKSHMVVSDQDVLSCCDHTRAWEGGLRQLSRRKWIRRANYRISKYFYHVCLPLMLHIVWSDERDKLVRKQYWDIKFFIHLLIHNSLKSVLHIWLYR